MSNVKLHIGLQRMVLIAYFLLLWLGSFLLFLKIDKLIMLPAFPFWGLNVMFILTILGWTYVFCLKENVIEILHKKNQNLHYALGFHNATRASWLNARLGDQINKAKITLDFKENILWALLGITFLIGSFFVKNKNLENLKTSKSSSTFINGKKENESFKKGKFKVRISPPKYTNLVNKLSEDLQISAPINSKLTWEIAGSSPSQYLQWYISNEKGQKRKFSKKNDIYFYSDLLIANGIYNILAYKSDSLVYQSPFYTLEVIADLAPIILPKEKILVQNFDPKKSFLLPVSAFVKDDYAVEKVSFVATLARGNGENIKFRERTFTLSSSAFKSKELAITLDLKELKFEPGDELFYYFLAIDNKWPEPNFSKSDTYFLKYKNPNEPETAEQNTMAVNILPEYFRSQRQIIIDTEKLIKKRNKLKASVFEEESNNIGFDQKSLRIRYGQYLGEEFETNLGHAAEADNPLAGFTHDHDSEDHQDEAPTTSPAHEHGEETTTGAADPLAALMEQYVHNHDSGEMNTFYEQSTRSLLKMSLEQMWQSELHLRLYEPEKALPFENKALAYLKEAQQKARNYVKKSGFDPSPIKEKEKRLTGILDKINLELSFSRLLKEEELVSLSTEILGLIDKNKLSLIEKQKLAHLLKIVPNEFKIKKELQDLLNGNSINQQAIIHLKNTLLKIVAYQKANNALPPYNEKNTNLRQEFFKQITQ
jgi:hypothetical protein